MADIIDHTEAFTIALTTPVEPVTCSGGSPHHGTGCNLLKHWDADKDGVMSKDDQSSAVGSYIGTGGTNPTKEELAFITDPNEQPYNINDKCPGCYAPPVQAKGEIVGLDYPASVMLGAVFDVDASTKNTGAASGTFRMDMYVNGAIRYQSSQFTLAAGATSSDKIEAVNALSSGSSMAVEVKCIRIV